MANLYEIHNSTVPIEVGMPIRAHPRYGKNVVFAVDSIKRFSGKEAAVLTLLESTADNCLLPKVFEDTKIYGGRPIWADTPVYKNRCDTWHVVEGLEALAAMAPAEDEV